MKYLMPIFKWLMLLTLLISTLGNSLLLHPEQVNAVEAQQQVLLDTEQLKVSAQSVQQVDGVHWLIDYEKKTTPNEQLKLKLNIPTDSQPVAHEQFERQADWLLEKEFTATAKGRLELVTATPELAVTVQLDQTMTEDILAPDIAGPHQITSLVSNPTDDSQQTSSSQSNSTSSVTQSKNQTTASMPQQTEVAEAAPVSGSLNLAATRAVKGLPKMTAVTRAISDPFGYTTDELGTYATSGINHYLGSSTTSQFLKNYHYGLQETASGIAQYDLKSDALSFEDGYHEYGSATAGRANLKKTIQPTATANQFKVQLDMIGDAVQPVPKIDIVLVLDKSGSMNTTTTSGNTRWQDLKEAVNEFSSDMLTDNRDIQIGLAAFGSTEIGNSRRPYGEISAFNEQANSDQFDGFTTSQSALMGHTLLTENIQTSGTPTFLGVDAGIKLLTNADYGARADAYKVLITITDGEPTFSPDNAYTSGNSLDLSLSRLASSARTNNSVLKMVAQETTLYSGNGTIVSNPPTVEFINNRYGQLADANLHRYGIGYHTGTTANAVVGALGPEGTYNVAAIESLATALQNIIDRLIATIAAADVTDPLSQFVDFVPGSLKGVNLVLNAGQLTSDTSSVSQPTITSGNIVKLTNLNLGANQDERQGYRITYNVTLKEAYRNGLFYPANETTYLTNGNGNNMYFAVPAVRSDPKPYQLALEKHDEFGRPLAGAAFELRTKGGTLVGTTISNEQGKIIFNTKIKVGDYVLTETHAPLGYESATQQPWTLSINDNHEATLTDNAGKAVALSVNEQDDYWQITTSGTNGVLVNHRKPFDLNLLKRDSNTQKVLAGAEFTLYDAQMVSVATLVTESDGQGQFKNAAGTTYPLKADQTYHVKETKAPVGYIVSTSVLKVVLDQDGQVTVTKDGLAFTQVELKNQAIQLTLDNMPEGGYLPATGGTGWRQYQYWAVALIVAALILSGYYYVRHKRRSTDKQ
ncbi:vWA domain-containing protein [Latilactobacillus fuchuensis]|uniref:vWA domain-containing protein n=1 Tax=Latilactobacillus fuchuensis TaxID=164393 RepID=UPI0020C7D508|nr:SpaA isopeptide-forming pilin-related protein [Latilactobacillus fuchuensis]MCP8857545.1 VWA domain-containing protein [Latilactobacillus fuchuensis]